jgi:hypothetical protein
VSDAAVDRNLLWVVGIVAGPCAGGLVAAEEGDRPLEVLETCATQLRAWIAGPGAAGRGPVSRAPTSYHLPLHRLYAALLHALIAASPEQLARCGLRDLYLRTLLPAGDPLELVLHPLSCFVLAGQVQAGLWRRNGERIVRETAVRRSRRRLPPRLRSFVRCPGVSSPCFVSPFLAPLRLVCC